MANGMNMRWASTAFALAALNASLTFSNIWPTLAIRFSTAFSVELAVLVIALVLVQVRRGSLSPAKLRWMSVLWVALIVGRYVDVTVRSLYGREVNLYWDLKFVPDVTAMFAFVATRWQAAAIALGVLLVPLLLYVPVRWALGRVSDAATHPRARLVLASTAGAVLLLWIAPAAGALGPEGVRFVEPVAPAYVRAMTELAYEMTGAGVRALGPAPPIRSNLSRVGRADVFLIFMESYGAVSWDRPEIAQPLAASRRRLEADIRESDRSVVSALVESTTFGGESWLAHLSLLSGTQVRDQRTNTRLMAQDRDTLVKAFGRHGYRTVAIMPGLLRSWPQGGFYGFEDIYNLTRLDYRGPPFGWWSINDQFALARVDALEVEPQPRRPLFIFFPTITTHAPFTPAPPYQKDWARVLTTNPYDQVDLDRAWSEQPDWMNLGPSYVQSLIYTHATLGGYLRLRADRDFVVILIGDHQPPSLVSGPDASWDVPVHVIAGRTPLLDRLRHHGFREGLAPHHPALARMDTLLPVLLDAFGGADDGSGSAERGGRLSSSGAARR
jgi:hypothetical protein